MNIRDKATALTAHLKSLDDFVVVADVDGIYNHMGATIVDAILQAGTSYDTVARPRIRRILEVYPIAVTTSAFLGLLHDVGPKTVLSWRDDEKPNRVVALAVFLRDRNVETEYALSAWLADEAHRPDLLSVRGVGPKTVDYLKILVGGQTAAVDRYVYSLFEGAGIPVSGYDEARDTLNATADNMGFAWVTLDHSVWRFMSAKNKMARTEDACS
jgi:hypothetical protein